LNFLHEKVQEALNLLQGKVQHALKVQKAFRETFEPLSSNQGLSAPDTQERFKLISSKIDKICTSIV
jgi:hypothetical protein